MDAITTNSCSGFAKTPQGRRPEASERTFFFKKKTHSGGEAIANSAD
jgi:hypothetical protein